MGRAPASVYWTRRGVILAVILFVVAAGYWVNGRLSHHHVRRPTATPTPSVTASPRPSTTPTVKRCPDSSMLITAATDSATYGTGSDVQLIMKLTNMGKTSCVRDIGPGVNSFTITSGGYPTWSSTDCSPPTGHKLTTITAKHSVTVTMVWHRQRSMRGCPTLTGSATSGFYELVVGNGALLSNPARFSLQ